MIKKHLTFAVLILAVSLSCLKKDKLIDDKSILIGKWRWVYTDHTYDICSGDPPSEEVLTPVTDGINYSMEFIEKGLVKYFHNGEELEKDRLVFAGFFDECSNGQAGYFSFHIYLNNNESSEERFQGCVSNDTLYVIRGFPYKSFEVGCETYTSYFVKE